MSDAVEAWDAWREVVAQSPACIGLGRAGAAVRTEVHLVFQAAHAAARDAVHLVSDPNEMRTLDVIEVCSEARDRQTHLSWPEL